MLDVLELERLWRNEKRFLPLVSLPLPRSQLFLLGLLKEPPSEERDWVRTSGSSIAFGDAGCAPILAAESRAKEVRLIVSCVSETLSLVG